MCLPAEFLMRERLRQQAEEEEERQHQRNVFQEVPVEDVGSGRTTDQGLETSTGTFVTTDLQSTSMMQKLTTSTRHRETQSQCCVLGATAGRSGFLCNPENYRPQVIMRYGLSFFLYPSYSLSHSLPLALLLSLSFSFILY